MSGFVVNSLKSCKRIPLGNQQCSLKNHTKKHSLDYWLRIKYAQNPDTKQVVAILILDLERTGLFRVVGDIDKNTGARCKHLELIT